MWARLLIWGGRAIRSFGSSSAVQSVGRRMSKVLAVGASSKSSRLGTIFRWNIRKGTRTAASISSRVEASAIGKYYSKLPTSVKSIISTVTTGLMIDKAVDWLFGSGDNADAPPIGPDGNEIEGDDVMTEILRNNGHSDFISSSDMVSRRNLVDTYQHSEMVLDMMSNTSLVMTGDYDGNYGTAAHIITDAERFSVLSRLCSTIKTIAHGSEHPAVFELFALQCLSSEMVNASPTNAAEEFSRSGDAFKNYVNELATAQLITFNQLYDEMSEAAAKDYFEENTAVFSDKLFVPKYDGPYAMMLASKLATDFSVGFSMSWWKKYLSDDKGGDDEAQALNIISKHSRLSIEYYRNVINAAQ